MRILSSLITLIILASLVLSCNTGGGASQPTAPTYPLSKPTGLEVEVGSESATISWNFTPGAAGYYVYISDDGVEFTRNTGGLILTTSYSVFDLINQQTYYMGVSAVGTGGWESSIAYPGGSPTAFPVVPGTEEVPGGKVPALVETCPADAGFDVQDRDHAVVFPAADHDGIRGEIIRLEITGIELTCQKTRRGSSVDRKTSAASVAHRRLTIIIGAAEKPLGHRIIEENSKNKGHFSASPSAVQPRKTSVGMLARLVGGRMLGTHDRGCIRQTSQRFVALGG